MATETQTRTGTSETLTFSTLPPFPSDIPTAPLHRLSLSKLRDNTSESDRLFSSCKDLGFFYLDLRSDSEGESLLSDADELFKLAPKLFDLGREELQKYDYKSQGSYMGYKGFGSAVVDEKGNLDRNEFYNVRSTSNLPAPTNTSRPQAPHNILHAHLPLPRPPHSPPLGATLASSSRNPHITP